MTGAQGLQGDFISGDILMNLDTEDDDELSIGCAGGVDNDINWNYQLEAADPSYKYYQVNVSGLAGGHSGMDIILGRANANKVLNRLILNLVEDGQAHLVFFKGGSLRNAIPREAQAIIGIVADQAQMVLEQIQKMSAALKAEFATTDPKLKIQVEESPSPAQWPTKTEQLKFVQALQATHDGIGRMSPDVENLVETSNNVASVVFDAGELHIKTLTRSDRESAKFDMAARVVAPWKLIGASVAHSGSYPGWKLDPNAPMLGMMKSLYQELFDEEPRVLACHAGLECGLLGQHYPNLEMISFGPTIRDPHSPDEKVSISSVQKFWTYFKEALLRVPPKG
jgi:dipeptidase D